MTEVQLRIEKSWDFNLPFQWKCITVIRMTYSNLRIWKSHKNNATPSVILILQERTTCRVSAHVHLQTCRPMNALLPTPRFSPQTLSHQDCPPNWAPTLTPGCFTLSPAHSPRRDRSLEPNGQPTWWLHAVTGEDTECALHSICLSAAQSTSSH